MRGVMSQSPRRFLGWFGEYVVAVLVYGVGGALVGLAVFVLLLWSGAIQWIVEMSR